MTGLTRRASRSKFFPQSRSGGLNRQFVWRKSEPMLQVKPKLQEELETRSTSNTVRPLTQVEPPPISTLSTKAAAVRLAPARKASRPHFPPINDASFESQTRVPV